jgi:mRNA interferase RelE/StbE
MASYEVFFKESVRKDLRKVPPADVLYILEKTKTLAENPRPPGCEKMSATDRYRIRYGRYRVVYSIQDRELTVWVVKVGHRKHVYR